MSGINELLRSAMAVKVKKADVTLDAVGDTESSSSAASYTETDLKVKCAAAMQQWAETDDLDESETHADRLLALMVGIIDANHNGEIDDEENDALTMLLNCAWDYLASKGVDDEDAGMLLNDWDNDAADRIRDLVSSSLPDGDSAMADIDSFAFGSSDQDATFDGVYKKKTVIKGGKKVRVNRRVSGTVHLSARQKLAVKKMQMKSHNAAAMNHRAKSMRVRKSFGLK